MTSFYFIATVANATAPQTKIATHATNRTRALAAVTETLANAGFDVVSIQNVALEQWAHETVRPYYSVPVAGPVATVNPTLPV